jgi:hypothetical protein
MEVVNINAVDVYTKISKKYEHQLKRRLVKELSERLREHMNDDEISEVVKNMKLICNETKQKEKEKECTKDIHVINVLHAEKVNQSNLLKFVIRELKENMSKSTKVDKRNKIAQRVINEMNKGCSFEDAKEIVYTKYSVFISYKVGLDNDRTNHENMNIEREYDEYSGRSIYGWDDTGEVLYKPVFGALIDPPNFREGGEIWREILESRWEHKSLYDDDDNIENFKG